MSAVWIPADRFLAVTDRCPDLWRRVAGTHADRRIRELRSGRQQFISLDVADRILTRLHLNHWFQYPASEGGLADIYIDGKQYGQPNRVLPNGDPAPTKFTSDADRLAARRVSWRESKRRLRDKAREEAA